MARTAKAPTPQQEKEAKERAILGKFNLVPVEGKDFELSEPDAKGTVRRKWSSNFEKTVAGAALEVSNNTAVARASGVRKEGDTPVYNVEPQQVSSWIKKHFPTEYNKKSVKDVDVTSTTQYQELKLQLDTTEQELRSVKLELEQVRAMNTKLVSTLSPADAQHMLMKMVNPDYDPAMFKGSM
ncbi:hypothetical protein [Vibrio splendidus]|uniref:hypothetical protein n=1 Tax=Vibrio splendidus TaxID=29497 RepID=UPI000D38B70E|nr:hypothetical protein [Vibrio splendidus]PTP95459.1 hypothetical protein CWO02_01050 [Vibrio splendidus]